MNSPNRIDLKNINSLCGLIANSIGINGVTIKPGCMVTKDNMRSYAKYVRVSEKRSIITINSKLIGNTTRNIDVWKEISVALGEYVFETYLHPSFYGMHRDKLPFQIMPTPKFCYNFSYVMCSFFTMGENVERLQQHKELVAFVKAVKRFDEQEANTNTDNVALNYMTNARAKNLINLIDTNDKEELTTLERIVLKDYISLLANTKSTSTDNKKVLALTEYIKYLLDDEEVPTKVTTKVTSRQDRNAFKELSNLFSL